jgi:3-oxoadipate enol-lactonase
MRGRDRFIRSGAVTLRVRSAGREVGPAIVLIHGWALDLDMWQAQFDALSDRYRVLAFDRRGFGESSGKPGIEHDVHDVERVLEVCGISQAAIVGMSQGARVALRWAMSHPARVSCMVLDGPPRDGLPSAVGTTQEIPIESYRELARREGMDAVRQVWLQHPLMCLHTSEPAARARLRQIAARYRGEDLLSDYLSQPSRVSERELLQLKVPTLILNGERDSDERRSVAAQLSRTLPNARLKIIPGAGHLAAIDNPDGYNNVLGEFLSSQPALAGGAGHAIGVPNVQ